MRGGILLVCVLALLVALAIPGTSMAADGHEKWIEIDSVSWSRHQPGAATRLAPGHYRTPQGQFLVVAQGKVAAKGPDWRAYRPGKPAGGPPGDVASRNPQQAGLLLPAVQKAQPAPDGAPGPAAAGRNVQTAPQKGIEPDEIDLKTRAADRTGAAPRPVQRARVPVQQMMLKLKPTQPTLVPSGPRGGMPGNVQGRPAEPPKYEIADCGTAASPMICCHHEAGDGSSCNLFKILCENAGGTAQGDGESAACSDW